MPLNVSGLLSCAHPHTSYTNPFSRSDPDALRGFLPSWWWDARDDEVKETENRDMREKRAKDSLAWPLNHSHIYNMITCVKSHNESATRHKRNNWLVVMMRTFWPLLTLNSREKKQIFFFSLHCDQWTNYFLLVWELSWVELEERQDGHKGYCTHKLHTDAALQSSIHPLSCHFDSCCRKTPTVLSQACFRYFSQ